MVNTQTVNADLKACKMSKLRQAFSGLKKQIEEAFGQKVWNHFSDEEKSALRKKGYGIKETQVYGSRGLLPPEYHGYTQIVSPEGEVVNFPDTPTEVQVRFESDLKSIRNDLAPRKNEDGKVPYQGCYKQRQPYLGI
jgi:hypothetical protein